MKKIKKSLKYVLISLCALLLVAAIVVPTVIFVGKQNKQESEVAFTKEQQILIDSIKQANSQTQEKDSLELVKTNEILKENGSTFSNDEIYAIYKDYFIAFDQIGNKVFYVKSNGLNINVFEKLKLSNSGLSGALDLNAIKVNDKYLVFSYITKNGDKSYKNYAVADYSNLNDVKILNTITFETNGTKLFYEGILVSNVKFNLYDDYFEIEFSQNAQTNAYSSQENKTIIKQLLYFYGDNTLKSTIESEQETKENIIISPSGNVRVKIYDDYAEFIYSTASGIETYKYNFKQESKYNFYVQNSGVFVEELSLQTAFGYSDSLLIDGKLYKYSYQFFSTKTKELSTVELSNGMVKASFSSHDDYLIVFENPRDVMVAANIGNIKILDTTGELILSYKATSIDSVIKYANNGRFVTCDGLFVIKSDKTAEQIKDFNSQSTPYTLLTKHIDNDWFVVRDEESRISYIMNISGEIFGNEGYVSVKDFGEGYFLTFKNDKVYWCKPSSGQKVRIENYEGIKDIYFLYFGMFLIKNEDGTYTIFNKKNEVVESNVLINTETRSDFILVTLTRNQNNSQYFLTLNNGYDENSSFVISNEKNLVEDEFKTEDENSVEEYASQSTTVIPSSEEVSISVDSEYDEENDSYKYPTSVKVNLIQTAYVDVYDDLETRIYQYREDKQEDGSIKYQLVYTPSNSRSYNSNKSGVETLIGSVTFSLSGSDDDISASVYLTTGDIGRISSLSIEFVGTNVGEKGSIEIKFICQMKSVMITYDDTPEKSYYSDEDITSKDGQIHSKYYYDYSCSTDEGSGSISSEEPITSGSGIFQPQKDVTYYLHFHRDTPYYSAPNMDHNCNNDDGSPIQRKYFTEGTLLSLNAYHYTFLGWSKGDESSRYKLNDEEPNYPIKDAQGILEEYGGKNIALGVSFDGTSAIYFYPCWRGDPLFIKFWLTAGNDRTSIYVDGNATSLSSDDSLSNGNYGSYIYQEIPTPEGYGNASITSIFGVGIKNVAPANLHTRVSIMAQSLISHTTAKSTIYLKNYVFDHWAVCDLSGTIVSYSDYTTPSSTFNSNDSSIVNVVAVYKERTTTALGSRTDENAIWRTSKDTSGSVSNSISDAPVKGFAGISEDDTTVYWANVESPDEWNKLDKDTIIRSKSNIVLFKVGLKIKSPAQIEPDSDTNQKIIGQFYNFSTISFKNYYIINGSQQSNIEFTYNATSNLWDATANATDNIQVQEGSNGVVVIFKMKIYGQMTNGDFITFGEFNLSPELDWKDTSKNDIDILEDKIDGYDVYNVTQGGTDIAGAYGYTSTDTSVFNNTHMLVVKPKTKYISYLTPSGRGSESQILTLSNYISNISTIKTGNSLTTITSSTELEQKGDAIQSSNNGAFSSIIYQHNLTEGWSSANGELIKYDGYEYYTFGYKRIGQTSGNYSLYADVYFAYTKIDDGRTLYQQQYAYFIFYNGNVEFFIGMNDIDTGELTASENENNGSSQAAHSLYTYGYNYENGENTNNKSKLSYFNYLKITPNDGYLINKITVTVIPKNATYLAGYEITYSLKYKPEDDETNNPVIISNSQFTQLIYTATDETVKVDGDPDLAQIIQLKISSPGFNLDWENGEKDSDGTVLLAVSDFVDDVEVVYETISYLDVFVAQYKQIDVTSYLQCEQYSSVQRQRDGKTYYYQSDYETKQGSWFNDTILSQVCLKAGDDSNIVVPDTTQTKTHTTQSNYYYQSNMGYMLKDIIDATVNYSKIAGYLLSDAYVYLKASELVPIELSYNSYSNEEKIDSNGVAVRLSDIKNQILDKVGSNISKECLEKNTLIVSFYADPITFKINYGNYSYDYTYDRHVNLETYWTSENADDYQDEKDYYSFVGWVSDNTFTKAATDNNPMLIYTDKKYYVSDDTTLNELIGSQWQFERDDNRLAEYTTTFTHKDFYVDGGYIVSDTGYSASENYNFWHSMKNLEVFKDDNSGVLTLFPVWMANEYIIRFNLNDNTTKNGTTGTLFRITDVNSYVYNDYTNLNNGFHFALRDNGPLSKNNYELTLIDGITTNGKTDECYVIVRFDTKEWYFSDINGNRLNNYQDFFENGNNMDRYGYSFETFLVKNNINSFEFTQANIDDNFMSTMKNYLRLKNTLSTIKYTYENQPNITEGTTNFKFYIYGKNGATFDVEKCGEEDETYRGTNVNKFITTTDNINIRSIEIDVKWKVNEYGIKIFDNNNNSEIYDLPITNNKKFKFDAQFDVGDFEGSVFEILSTRPYRHGYDFAGWTLSYVDGLDNDINYPALYGVNNYYENYWIEQYADDETDDDVRTYMWLCEKLIRYYNYYKPQEYDENLSKIITQILYYVDGSTNRTTFEQLGDLDKDDEHFVYFYSNWTPMVYSVDIDLNIPNGSDGNKDYTSVLNKLIVGLFSDDDGNTVFDNNGVFAGGILQEGISFNNYGIASFNYKKNSRVYKSKISNVCFKIYYGQTVAQAVMQLSFDIYDSDGNKVDTSTAEFHVKDLYVELANHNFGGWTICGYQNGTWTETTYTIDSDSSVISTLFADDFKTVSNYGSIKLMNNATLNIYKDYIITTNENDNKTITEKLYVENKGVRYYFNKIHKSDEIFDDINLYFDEINLKILDENALYYLYPNEEGFSFYVKDMSDGDKYTDSNNKYTGENSEGVLFPDNIVNKYNSNTYDNTLKAGFYNSQLSRISFYSASRTRAIGIQAKWTEIDDNAGANNINFENGNNGSTGYLVFNYSAHKLIDNKNDLRIFYTEQYAENTNVLTSNLIYCGDNEIQYTIILELKLGDAEVVLLTFDKNYLYYSGNKIMLDEDDNLYIQMISNHGIITKVYFSNTDLKCTIFWEDPNNNTIKQEIFGGSEFDIRLMHHFRTTEVSNKGLGGIFNVEIDDYPGQFTTNAGVYNESTGDIQDSSEYTDFENEHSFKYDTGFNAELLPFYQGRFLNELSFEYDYILWSENAYDVETKQDIANTHIKKFNIVKRNLVFYFFWDNENRVIGIKNVSIMQGGTKLFGVTISDRALKNQDYYLNWWTNSLLAQEDNKNAYDEIMKLVVFNAPFSLNLQDNDFFINVNPYIEKDENKVFNRKDINVINLKVQNIKQNITISAKYAVQTFEVDLFNVVDHEYNSRLEDSFESENEPNWFLSNIDTAFYSNKTNTFSNGYPKLATVDAGIRKNDGVNIPYGYFIYGYNYSSGYLGNRPIDNADNLKIIQSKLYGYKYIYLDSNYFYADSDYRINAENSDLINSAGSENEGVYEGNDKFISTSSPMIGSTEQFRQSVRSDDDYTLFTFGGLYYYSTVTEDNKLLHKLDKVSKEDEDAYLNSNRQYYAYYYSRKNTVDAHFYIWDEDNVSYKEIDDLNNDYSYRTVNITKEYYDEILQTEIVDGVEVERTVLKLKEGEEPLPILYTFNESGIDSESFYMDTFMQEDLTLSQKNNYMQFLKKVAMTYWFDCYNSKAYLGAMYYGDFALKDLTGVKVLDNGKYLIEYASGEVEEKVNVLEGNSFFGASLYKKTNSLTKTINGKKYPLYQKISVHDFNPKTDKADDVVVFLNYYIEYIVHGTKYYAPIEYYKEGSLFAPEVEYYVDSNGTHYGNHVSLWTGKYITTDTGMNKETVDYYFNYKNQKLYQPSMYNVEVEVTDLNYKVKTAFNDKYDFEIINRLHGYDIHKMTLQAVPDSSVGYWMPNSDFMFWAAITEEEYSKITGYYGNAQGNTGLIYSAYLTKFRENNPTDEQLDIMIEELNNKMKDFTFKDLIKKGIIIKKYYFDNNHLVEAVDLEFSINLGNFSNFSATDINVSAKFKVLKGGLEMTSTIYAVQIFKQSQQTLFEKVGDTAYVYDEYNGDFVNVAKLTDEEYNELMNSEDKTKALDDIIKRNLENHNSIVVNTKEYVRIVQLTIEEYESVVSKAKTVQEIIDEHLDDGEDIILDTSDAISIEYVEIEREIKDDKGNVIGINYYDYNYDVLETNYPSAHLVKFYYKSNLPSYVNPYVVAVI